MLNYFKVIITDIAGEKHELEEVGFDAAQVMKQVVYNAKEQGFLVTNVNNEKNKMSSVMSHSIVNVHIEPSDKFIK